MIGTTRLSQCQFNNPVVVDGAIDPQRMLLVDHRYDIRLYDLRLGPSGPFHPRTSRLGHVSQSENMRVRLLRAIINLESRAHQNLISILTDGGRE